MVEQHEVTIVVFNVAYDPLESGLSEDEAMLQIFAYSGPLALRRLTPNRYLSCNYDEIRGIWFGEFHLTRAATATNVIKDAKRGYRATRLDATQATESWTTFAYDPQRHQLAYRERGALPHTRLRTYVQEAASAANVEADLLPHMERSRSIADLLKLFDSIETVTVRYRHSQSPGNKFVDDELEATGAYEETRRLVSPSNKSLRKKGLLNPELPIGKVLDHLTASDANGDMTVVGKIGSEMHTRNSHDRVVRFTYFVPSDDDTGVRDRLIAAIRQEAQSTAT